MKQNSLFLFNEHVMTNKPDVKARVTMVEDGSYTYINYGTNCSRESFEKYLEQQIPEEERSKYDGYSFVDMSEIVPPIQLYLFIKDSFISKPDDLRKLSENMLERWFKSVYTYYEFDLDSILKYIRSKFNYTENIYLSDRTHKYYVKVDSYERASYMEFGNEVDVDNALLNSFTDVTQTLNKFAEEITV